MSQYENMTDAAAIAAIMQSHECDKEEAVFILAIERGEIEGDVVEV